jgi:hypothetical protein
LSTAGVIVLAGSLFLSVPHILRAREMAGWPNTEGRILGKEVDDTTDDIYYSVRFSFRPAP